MADYTDFMFTQLGERAIVKVSGTIAQTGIWYAQGSPVVIEKQNVNHFGEPYDKVTYKAKNETLISNEANIVVNFPPNKNNQPSSVDSSVDLQNNQTINIIDHITYNDAVDRIKIISYTVGVGELEYFNSSIYPNKVIMQYDFEQIKFNTLTGIGSPYQKIYYKVGNANGFSSTTYSLSINIIGKASLLNLLQNQGEINDSGVGYKYIEATIGIQNGYVNGTAKFKMNVNLSSNAWPTNTQNLIIIDYPGGSKDVNSNGDTFINIPLGPTGEVNLTFTLGISLANLPVTGDINFTLVDINGDTNLVSSNNVQTINVNL